MERLPLRSSNDILSMEGVACVLKKDAKILWVGVVEKGYSIFWGKKFEV